MCGAGQGWAGLSRERIHPRLPQGARQRGGLRRPCAVPAGAGQEPRALPEGLPGLRALPAAGPPRWLELGGPPVVVAAAWVIYSLLLLSVEREEKKKASSASEQAQRNFLSFVKASSCFQAFIPYKAVFSVKPEPNPF